jgi:hypothetical protein
VEVESNGRRRRAIEGTDMKVNVEEKSLRITIGFCIFVLQSSSMIYCGAASMIRPDVTMILHTPAIRTSNVNARLILFGDRLP